MNLRYSFLRLNLYYWIASKFRERNSTEEEMRVLLGLLRRSDEAEQTFEPETLERNIKGKFFQI